MSYTTTTVRNRAIMAKLVGGEVARSFSSWMGVKTTIIGLRMQVWRQMSIRLNNSKNNILIIIIINNIIY